METFFIYVLKRDAVPFYVGVTKNTVSRKTAHKAIYGEIEMQILQQYVGCSDAAFLLEGFWINHYISNGHKLSNLHKVRGKRKARSYKCTDAIYKAAMKMAKSRGTTLAVLIEEFFSKYAEGYEIIIQP